MPNKKKLLLTALLSSAMLMPLVACSKTSDSTLPSSSSSSSSSSSTSSSSSSPDTEKEVPTEEGKYKTNKNDGGVSNKGKYYTDYATLDDAYKAGRELNIQLAREGQVLLKNENNTLPLSKKEKNISVFGYNSTSLRNGAGSGSGGGSYGIKQTDLHSALELAGFNVNTKLKDFYASHTTGVEIGTGDKTWSSSGIVYTEYAPDIIPDSVRATYDAFDDAAIFVISREGGEDKELTRSGLDGDNKHELQLTNNEKKMIKHLKSNFSKVIILLNSSNAMELADIQAKKTADNYGVDAILWIGGCGNDGAIAIGEILNGTTNPSGRLVDTYVADFKKDPTYYNVCDNSHLKDESGNPYDTYVYVDGQKVTDGGNYDLHSIEYREDIYMGYRYYETKAADMGEAGEKWYQDTVVYPFGYGLSYTNFQWELVNTPEKAIIPSADTSITIDVKVTNTGNYAGKDVVELYNTAPYTKGGIEKSAAALVQYAKTDLLEPGESQTLSITIAAQDLASFDWSDKNDNGFKGYELEKGDYTLSLRKNSHESVLNVTRTVKEDILCKTDLDTGSEILPLFGGEIDGLEQYKSTNDALENNLLSRSDMSLLPKTSTKQDRTYKSSELKDILEDRDYFSFDDKKTDPWYVENVPTAWKQADSAKNANQLYKPSDSRSGIKRTGANADKASIQLNDLAGVTYTEPTKDANGNEVAATDEGTKKWDEFMNQLTFEEMAAICGFGNFGGLAVDSIGRLASVAADGASQYASNTSRGQFTTEVGTFWVTSVVIASTWNQELCYKHGRQVGNESLFTGCNGWYAPSTNIHRSPFSGRNFEYYSEDGVLAGLTVGNVVKGTSSKGVVCYVKHFFMNDQETSRMDANGIIEYATEQAMREIYAKPFEYAVKYGDSIGIMSAYNTIGLATCSTNYAVLECLLRQEWGFKGHVITDMLHRPDYRELNQLVRAGNDLPLVDVTTTSSTNALEGWYDSATNKVYVAKDNENAQLAKAERARIFGAGVTSGENLFNETLKGYETVSSATHWYAVRKSAQRILFNNLHSNAQKNGYNTSVSTKKYKADIQEEQTGWWWKTTIGYSATIDVSEIINQFDSQDINVSVIKIEGPEGFELTGTYSNTDKTVKLATSVVDVTKIPEGEYQVELTITLDGWVKVNVPISVELAWPSQE